MSSLEQLMLNYSPYMMLLVEPGHLRILVANRVVEQTLGYASEELAAMTITDIESSLQDVFYWEEVRNGQYQDIDGQEGLYLCADGSLLTVTKSVRMLDHHGTPLLLVQARDIQHERKVEDALEQTLSQLRATLESTGNGILVIDWQGRIASMNRLFSSMWEIPEDLLLDRDDSAILEFMVQQVVEDDACRTRLQAIADSSETEDLFRLKDARVFECRSRPQYLGERIVGRVFGYNDITERTRAEEALRDSRARLEERVRERTADLQTANATLEAEKLHQEELIDKLEDTHHKLLQSEKMASIGQLAAGVAHEINNPIGFVNSNLGTMQRYAEDIFRLLAAYEKVEGSLASGVLDDITRLKNEIDAAFLREDIGNLLTESVDGLQRVKRIVQDLKEFSRVDGSEPEWADLEAGIESTLNVVSNELKDKAEVVREYGHIAQIRCFPSQLNQVFMNLLLNAAHAIDSHGSITVRTGHDRESVWVEVADTGKGIKPEHLEKIFDPFFTTKPVGKGTGLGLSLAYGIVHQHGGHIEVSSEFGKGSIFRVILPSNPA
ncbi:PAS/PAC sensor signal transduction histidine kinase [Candidatus Accumulibacter aalborgensis]|uniref:histidine kinase n=1 Tax=Candidatus Accumulibacter aalborgensis TaxID=1860102 RepID=A0A1A8XVK8_9PROT|nr:ATP-binding protein [Candidatus Accumulibacter aalborgensis]SBT09065.1 PAS/PAC sensor signal transduction histidine kinase [Candidatus Accumulibacter aalborgensis]